MKICCLSDLHGHLPPLSQLDKLDFDVIMLAGDIVPGYAHNEEISKVWLDQTFRKWLLSVGKPVIGCAGNHDFIFQNRKDLIPKDLPWTYLQDESTVFEGLKIWGAPWQLNFGKGWAFNGDEAKLREKWKLIPNDTDIIIVHGPPRGYGDFSPYGLTHTGSYSLTQRIYEICPKLLVCGHIHSQHGEYKMGETIVVNASYIDENYKVAYPPIVVEI